MEKDAEPATVCVTGGTGYIAGAIIARLLAAGHTVHATVRDPNNEQKLRWLRTLPKASTNLKFFKVMPCFCHQSTTFCQQLCYDCSVRYIADMWPIWCTLGLVGPSREFQSHTPQWLCKLSDTEQSIQLGSEFASLEHSPSSSQADLEDAEAFMAPIKGCRYVLHTASPVVMAPPKGKASVLTACAQSLLCWRPSISRLYIFISPAMKCICQGQLHFAWSQPSMAAVKTANVLANEGTSLNLFHRNGAHG